MRRLRPVSPTAKAAASKDDMKHAVCMISLGCVRNLVDSQVMLGAIRDGEVEVVDLDRAETVIVNTCGFIEEAKQESLDTIAGLIDLKKRGEIRHLVVAGCLVQRYVDVLHGEFPEIDAFIGVQELLQDRVPVQRPLTPPHMAYLKICESCYNHCAFCAIPKIKGRFVSRTIESVCDEVRGLDRRGVKELNIVGQDITAYGMDLYRQQSLARLLRQICRGLEHIRWVRLLYAFPAHITEELIGVIAEEPRICKYVDVPLQHCSDPILTAMNRRFSQAQIRDLIGRLRSRIPGVRIRTAFITGLPGERERDFEELLDFVREMRFDKVGVFAYSPEEGTPAFNMRGRVPGKEAKRRRDLVMEAQQVISRELQAAYVGKAMTVLIEERQEDGIYVGRSEYDAPDVDGVVYVQTERTLAIGDFYEVMITDAYEYDLAGEAR